MSQTSRRVMLGMGLCLVFGLGSVLAYLAYCNHRAVKRLDVVGMDRRVKPASLPLLPDGAEDQAPVEYEYFEKRGVTDVHRVGAQIFYIASGPLCALILVGVLLITRALSRPRRAANEPTEPIDPLAD
jgi:hypothetical protein